MAWRKATTDELAAWGEHGTPPGQTYRLVAGTGLMVWHSGNSCEHVACNRDTGWEIVKCPNEATHRITWPDTGKSQIACERHVTVYRNIIRVMDERDRVVNRPEFVRLEAEALPNRDQTVTNSDRRDAKMRASATYGKEPS